MLSRPVLGFGLETYSLISVARVKDIHEAAHGAPGPDPTVADRLHNLWLDTIWSGGFTTLVLLLLILGLAFTRLSRWLQRSKDRSEAAALLGALIAWLVANQAGFDCSITAIFWMLLLARIASAEVLL
jgi:O-antigen ligase